ncbi:hypothetical protein V8B97DRAFT_1917682 [Scleroderma yunnanense]
MAPRPHKSKEQAAAEHAVKVAAFQKKSNQMSDQIAGLVSLEQCMVVNQATALASTHQDGNKWKKIVPRPKLREEVQSMIEQPNEGATVAQGSQGKWKGAVAQYATSSVNMPTNDYGGFHDEDESMERNFAHKTMSNSQDVFIPTLLAHCGTFLNPWNPLLSNIIASSWQVIFVSIPYDEQLYGSGTPTFLVACQCIYDWHRKFAETAEKTVAVWFDSKKFSDDNN